MFKALKNHPFAVEAFFERSMVLTFAVPKERLEGLIPECVTLDTFDDKWAFLAMAIVKTKDLRPKGFPKIIGNDFILIGYRIFVRYTNNAGKRLRGLYIIKSETNKKKMQYLGNIFTQYSYTTTDIAIQADKNCEIVKSSQSGFEIVFEQTDDEVKIPLGSPFKNWKEARRFAGPLPFTFTYNEPEKKVLIIEGVRQNWTPQPVKVVDFNIDFLQAMNMKDAILANAFEIRSIPYHWKKAKFELWK